MEIHESFAPIAALQVYSRLCPRSPGELALEDMESSGNRLAPLDRNPGQVGCKGRGTPRMGSLAEAVPLSGKDRSQDKHHLGRWGHICLWNRRENRHTDSSCSEFLEKPR